MCPELPGGHPVGSLRGGLRRHQRRRQSRRGSWTRDDHAGKALKLFIRDLLGIGCRRSGRNRRGFFLRRRCRGSRRDRLLICWRNGGGRGGWQRGSLARWGGGRRRRRNQGIVDLATAASRCRRCRCVDAAGMPLAGTTSGPFPPVSRHRMALVAAMFEQPLERATAPSQFTTTRVTRIHAGIRATAAGKRGDDHGGEQ